MTYVWLGCLGPDCPGYDMSSHRISSCGYTAGWEICNKLLPCAKIHAGAHYCSVQEQMQHSEGWTMSISHEGQACRASVTPSHVLTVHADSLQENQN